MRESELMVFGWNVNASRCYAPCLPAVVVMLLLMAAASSPAAVVTPTPPKVAARSHILVDYDSGKILTQENADERLEPASLTKMMTSYVVFSELREGNIQLSDRVRISEKAWRMTGSRMFIEVGKEVTVEDLLKGLIIQSGNDASVALAEHVAGDEVAFSGLMNQYAKKLGMLTSQFQNASGLPGDAHYTSARDMAKIAAALVRDFPEYYQLHALKKFVFNEIVQYNRNKLLWRDESVDGLKTGYTESAGYCLVASAKRNGMRLVSVVMGADSEKRRSGLTQSLFNFGFRFYETHLLYQARQPVTKVRVWQGEREEVELGLPDALYVTLARGQYKKLAAVMEPENTIIAPIAQGETKGSVKVSLGDDVLAERPLVVLRSVAEGSLWRRVSDYIRLWFE